MHTKDSATNSIKYEYGTSVYRIPFVSFKYLIRTIYTKYFIGSDKIILVYSFYCPNRKQENVYLTTINKNGGIESRYLPENEMLAILNDNGLTLKTLSVSAPSWKDDGSLINGSMSNPPITTQK